MDGLFSELGKKLAERWLSLLFLPGALYLATVVAARILGHPHALDPTLLAHRINVWATQPAAASTGGQVILLVAVLAAASAAGLTAQALGSLIERGVLASGWRTLPAPLHAVIHRWVQHRVRRWEHACGTYRTTRESEARTLALCGTPDPRARHAAHHALTAIALERPDRPTWTGDRIHAAVVRLDRDLHVDLLTVWPVLWLHLPDHVRAEVTAARVALSRATTLTAWSLLYLPVTLWWWPAAPLSLVLALTARHRTRTAATTYAQLLEATIHLHLHDLAIYLNTTPTGDALHRRLHPPPRQPTQTPSPPTDTPGRQSRANPQS
jgi:hypothetical protein